MGEERAGEGGERRVGEKGRGGKSRGGKGRERPTLRIPLSQIPGYATVKDRNISICRHSTIWRDAALL